MTALEYSPAQRERDDAQQALACPNLDFGGAYMAAGQLEWLAANHPQQVGSTAVRALCDLLLTERFSTQKQCFFLYKKGSNALTNVLLRSGNEELGAVGVSTLVEITTSRTGPVQKAAAEALGTLPLDIPAQKGPPAYQGRLPAVRDTAQLAGAAGIHGVCRGRCLGRSFVAETPDCLLVIKLAREGEDAQNLFEEAWWMERLVREAEAMDGFHVPRPLRVDGEPVFRLRKPPTNGSTSEGLHPDGLAMAFVAPRGYFAYPNEPGPGRLCTARDLCRMLDKAARQLGALASSGIVHTAPIPLFHNRVQRERRNDGGYYQWQRGGRLDRWLASCRHPNLGGSGLRDFEHFAAHTGPMRELYLAMGKHVLGLLLVAGSWFRAHDPARVGVDSAGNPVDARDLFDLRLFRDIARMVFDAYHEGFAGAPRPAGLNWDLEPLVEAMVDQMGVDRHMEEILRVTDQQNMTDQQFEAFLASRDVAEPHTRGEADVIMLTGPHLGQFAGRISLPEILDYAAAAAGLCVAGRWLAENGRPANMLEVRRTTVSTEETTTGAAA